MKQLCVCFVGLMAWGNLSAQAPKIEWQKALGGTDREWDAESIQQTTDGGYIVAGHTESNDGYVWGAQGKLDWWIVKLNGVGDTVWTKTLGGTLWDFVFSIQQTTDGGYIVAGQAGSTDGDISGNQGGFDFWIVKLNNDGDTLWTKTLGGTSNESAYCIRQTTDGGFIVAGMTGSNIQWRLYC